MKKFTPNCVFREGTKALLLYTTVKLFVITLLNGKLGDKCNNVKLLVGQELKAIFCFLFQGLEAAKYGKATRKDPFTHLRGVRLGCAAVNCRKCGYIGSSTAE